MRVRAVDPCVICASTELARVMTPFPDPVRVMAIVCGGDLGVGFCGFRREGDAWVLVGDRSLMVDELQAEMNAEVLAAEQACVERIVEGLRRGQSSGQ